MILVLDDEPVISEAVKALLEMHGYETTVISSCEAALAFLENHQPQLILSDVNMPERSGLEFLGDVRSRGLADGVPLIFISGKARPEDRELGIQAGATDYLEKPVDPRILIETVKKYIAQ